MDKSADGRVDGLPGEPGVEACRSCEGRGWKLVFRLRVLPMSETSFRQPRTICMDCLGTGYVDAA